MKKDRIIRMQLPNTRIWFYVGKQGQRQKDKTRAEKMTSDQATRMLTTLRAAEPGNTYEEMSAPVAHDDDAEEPRAVDPRTRSGAAKDSKE